MKKLLYYIVITTITLICLVACNDSKEGYKEAKTTTELSCIHLPDYFDSYDQLNSMIRSPEYSYSDTEYSNSWISKLEYFSCDGNSGYVIMHTTNKGYTFQNIPINVWQTWEQSSDWGKYYHANIKNKNDYKINL